MHRRAASRLLIAVALACVAAAHCASATEQATGADRQLLEQQLKAARERLDASAREVADLTRRLYGEPEGDVLQFAHGPRGAMIGVNIDNQESGGDGVRIAGVSPGGPAATAGLRAGDVIVALDGKPLVSNGSRDASAQLVEWLRATDPGVTVTVEYLRDGKRQSAAIKTTRAEPALLRLLRDQGARLPMEGGGSLWRHMAPPPFDLLLDPGVPFGSLELVSMTPRLGQYFGTNDGMLVVRAPEAGELRLEEGDVILSIDGRIPENPGHAFRILRSYQPGEQVRLQVLRNRKRLELAVKMPAGPEAGSRMHFRQPRPPAAPLPPRALPPPLRDETAWNASR